MLKNDEINKKYYNKIVKYRKILLENQIKVYTKIIDITQFYNFMISINYNKINSMMISNNKSDLTVDYILDRIKYYNKHYNVLLDIKNKT